MARRVTRNASIDETTWQEMEQEAAAIAESTGQKTPSVADMIRLSWRQYIERKQEITK